MKIILPLVCSLFIITSIDAQYTISKKTITDIGIVNNGVIAMTLDSSNKIVTVGSVQEGNVYKLCFTRHKPNGSIDSSFGKYGADTFTVQNIIPSTYQGANLRCISIQPDGKIVAAGTAWYTAGTNFLSNTLVMRLNKNGTLDTTFGDKGTVRTNINSSTGLSIDEANGIAVQPDGRIIIAGSTYDYVQHRFLVVRYNTDGSVDNSFGSGGANTFSISGYDDEAFAIKVLDNGKIVIAGESYLHITDYSYTVALMRLKQNGYADTDFGKQGMVTTIVSHGAAVANALAVLPNNKIVIAGTTQDAVAAQKDLLCIKYTANGTVDSGFGNNGKVIIDIQGRDDVANSILVQDDNKILLGGYATNADSITEFMCVRLSAAGNKDQHFGKDGVATTGLYQQGDEGQGMAFSGSGKIIMAGNSHFGAARYISLVRFTVSGNIDNGFGNEGKTSMGIGSSEDIAYKIVKSPWDNSLFVAGTANGYWAVAKYKKASLKLDSSFGVNGIASVNYKNAEDPTDKPTLAIDAASGKIYLAGASEYGSATIVRFNKNGLPDKSFGKNGAVNYSLYIFYGGFEIAPDHKILLAGVQLEDVRGYNFLARFNTDGSVDSTFGENGQVKNLPLTVNSVQVKQGGNRLLLAGRIPLGFDGVKGVLCLKLNGTTDNSFGVNGLAQASKDAYAPIYFRQSLAQDEKGRILVSGGSGFGDFSVVRFLRNGVPDSSFAGDGTFTQNVTTGGLSDNYNEGISAKCAGAYCSIITSGIKFNDFNEQSRAVMIAIKDNGTIDSLNKNGYLDTSFYNDRYEGLFAALVDTITATDEVIYVAGKARKNSNGNFIVVKIIKPLQRAKPANFPGNADYKISIAPNPAHSRINISFMMPQAGKAVVRVTNYNGNIIKQESQYYTAGKQQLAMQLPALVAGTYFITITSSAGSNTQTLLVE